MILLHRNVSNSGKPNINYTLSSKWNIYNQSFSSLSIVLSLHTHTHTHTYIYKYIYIKDVCCRSKERIRIYLKIRRSTKRFVCFWFIYFVLTYVLYIQGSLNNFQIFFLWALFLIVHTWNSSPLPSNLFRLQCTCTVPTTSGRPHKWPLVWACQWPFSQPLSFPQLSHNDSLWA